MKDLITKAFSTILVVCLISTFCISNVNIVYAQDADTDVSTEVNSAKEQMEEEENYIVALVSQRTGESLTTSDWKICLNYLRENYNSITTETDIDRCHHYCRKCSDEELHTKGRRYLPEWIYHCGAEPV